MGNSIRLHKEHGLNPTMPTCFYCGEEKGEIALLGAAYKGEAPMKMCMDKVPCQKCQDTMEQGLMLIEVRDGETDTENPYRTGKIAAIKLEAARELFTGFDLDKQRVSFQGTTPKVFSFDIEAAARKQLLEGLDDIDQTLQYESDITRFEKNYDPYGP